MQRPKSAVSSWAAFAGALVLAAILTLGRLVGTPALPLSLAMLLGTASAVLAWSVLVDRVHLDPETGLDWRNPHPWPETLALTRVKLIGYFATLLALGGGYALLRHYSQPEFRVYFALVLAASPVLFLAAPLYILWTTRHMTDPRDGLWHLGRAITRQGGWDAHHLADHARAWAIKGFFLAFLLSAFPSMVNGFQALALPRPSDPVQLASFLLALVFLYDVTFGTFGYALALRVFNGHIRSANPHLAAWVAALSCYPPILVMAQSGLLNYNIGGRPWDQWLQDMPVLLWIWAVLMVALTAIYAWATLVFGARFSNLTHRGIITHGPYAYVRHPAYLAKNSFWWLAYMPFLNTLGPGEALRNCLLLGLVNLIYYWRAKTEERHLMTDPAYRAYCDWLAEHGLAAKLRRRFQPAGRSGQAI